MEAAYWQKAWSENRIGFHQKNVNKRLIKYWPRLDLKTPSQVFVPLCGKSTDLLWLHEQGHSVLGVELSAKAATAFYVDNNLQYSVTETTDFTIFTGLNEAEGLDIWAGDFFNLTRAHVADCTAYYDRAAMIALPDDLRAGYAAHLGHIMKAGTSALLLAISYDQSKMKGPPHSVSDENVRKLLGEAFDICELEHYSGAQRLGNLAQRGLETLDERVYLLKRN